MDIGKILYGENVGGIDLMVRAFVGTLAIVLLAGIGFESIIIRLVLGILAFLGLFTSITRHCLPYGLIGFSTAKKQ